MTGPILFHLAFPVHDLIAAKRFYVDGLGCALGRESDSAMTLQLGGHQIVAQLSSQPLEKQRGIYPRHFGLIFTSEQEWQSVADRARAKALTFYQQPRLRYAGTRIEHRTFSSKIPRIISLSSSTIATSRRFSVNTNIRKSVIRMNLGRRAASLLNVRGELLGRLKQAARILIPWKSLEQPPMVRS